MLVKFSKMWNKNKKKILKLSFEKDMIEIYFEKRFEKEIYKDLILKIKVDYLTNKKLKDMILELKDWTFLNKKVTNFKFLNQSY